jgi:hypothetical protein
MQIKYCLILKTIPEWNNKHQELYTCSIGFSPELGLIRLYPLPITGIYSGYAYTCEVKKRKVDTRVESYELIGDMHLINGYNKESLNKVLLNYMTPSVDFLNKKNKSIGVLKITDYKIQWQPEKRFLDNDQIGMFEDVELDDFMNFTKDGHSKSAVITFKDADGLHRLQYNDWGIYEYGRKFAHDKDAFRFIQSATHLIVGNMLSHRTTWMALKLIHINTFQLALI